MIYNLMMFVDDAPPPSSPRPAERAAVGARAALRDMVHDQEPAAAAVTVANDEDVEKGAQAPRSRKHAGLQFRSVYGKGVNSQDSKGGFYEDSEVEEERLCAVCPRGARGAQARGSRAMWREAAAEVACSALLVLLTCLPACAQAPPLQRALAAGLVVAAIIQCFDHVSGAMMNPAVTLAAIVVGHRSARRGAVYLAAQAVGAAAGGAVLHALAPDAPYACRTLPANGVSLAQAVCVEALLGGVLAWANCASWDARNRRLLDSWPLRMGFTVTGLTLAAGSLTGASANPLRSLAPALYAGDYTAIWVYCVGPPSGALCAAAVYCRVWGVPVGVAARGDSPPRASVASSSTRPLPRASP